MQISIVDHLGEKNIYSFDSVSFEDNEFRYKEFKI